jgi:tetratricopeptide (TPR) repeat protein
LWSERYDREVARVLEIQSEVARAVARQIELTLSPQQADRFATRRTIDPRAQDAYFRGLSHRGDFEAQTIARSVKAFQEAVAIEPGFALAHASLAASCIKQWYRGMASDGGFNPEPHPLTLAEEAAKRALALDPLLGDAHAALGLLLALYDPPAAERELERSRELGVRDPFLASHTASLSLVQGVELEILAGNDHPDPTTYQARAMHLMDEAIASAPLDLDVRTFHAQLLRYVAQPERALAEADRVLEIDPDHRVGRVERAYALEQLGRLGEAAREWKKLLPQYGAELERISRSEGKAGYWRFAARSCDPAFAAPGSPWCVERAILAYAQAGMLGEALRIVKDGGKTWVDPMSAAVRADPRFGPYVRADFQRSKE